LHLDSRSIYEALLQRERLGSTGIGKGIAIPHGKFNDLPSLCGLFARLENHWILRHLIKSLSISSFYCWP